MSDELQIDPNQVINSLLSQLAESNKRAAIAEGSLNTVLAAIQRNQQEAVVAAEKEDKPVKAARGKTSVVDASS